MPIKFKVTKTAQKHTRLAIEWLKKTSDKSTARDVIKGRFDDFKDQLKTLPECGQKCQHFDDERYRELFIGQYRFVYKIEPKQSDYLITIIIFCHTRMNFQTILAQVDEYTK
ncbi:MULTISPECIES: type II toxin-antitoxin system RelE/ParE family toxin [unclassified Pseudoalteromonas]|uniref:type II toxin-antitoxin system RelE/ParE family toxin n=1 Tax=unclassified Pseudoalteromonas TaxID=194690 RepID=UPI0005AA0A41|nr:MULTISPECIES: type II toxin-antitoxin system RelE/ParE family toxin [unclassified Pseudoalteromonas]